MDIREQIGNRITKARKALGISIKELSSRTKMLSPARISNWEQGTRSPGPVEAKLLAQNLNVSASYILCLTDNLQGELTHSSGHTHRYIPVLAMTDALHARELLAGPHTERAIVIDGFNKSQHSECLFAVRIEDTSMQPDFCVGDLVVIDAHLSPKPGDYVLVYLMGKKQGVLRKYCEANECLFQLLPSNELWATVNVEQKDEVELIGVVIEHRRFL